MLVRSIGVALCLLTLLPPTLGEREAETFEPIDVFSLEYASDPQISPDGERVVYVRRSGDIMTDRFRSELWMVEADGTDHRALVQEGSPGSPRWSPSGDRVLFTASESGHPSLRVLWMDTREVTTLATLPSGARDAAWSPDGTMIAFAMFVRDEGPKPAAMPEKPEGATWNEPARIIDRVLFRADGRGFLEQGITQLFIVPGDGGTPRQLTSDAFDCDGPISWTPDGRSLIFASNRQAEWEYDPIESEVYELVIESGELRRLTDRDGPDRDPALSPDGRYVACVGFDDRRQGYQVSSLWLIDRQGGAPARELTGSLDRSVRQPVWAPDSGSVWFLYDDRGVTTLARVSLEGRLDVVFEGIGGGSLGRPYPSGSFSLARGGRFATVVTTPVRPGDVAVGDRDGVRRLTNLNEDLLGHKALAGVEAITVNSSADGREVQAWVMRPPGFDPSASYPLILEIHGGPFANYGPRFAAENQLYAAAGYVVVYANPRGSTSYGQAFGNLIHHAYPSQDYDDLMSVVDRVIEMGSIDEERLYVTGGSGGGVLTAWIVGKTDRFRAAVVAKPVINWLSFALTADMYTYFARYWFPAPAWEDPMHYWERSPLSLVGHVTTPTMLLTGEEDLRTPMGESEQYFQALQLRRVPTRLVRIPGASHGIAARPSGLVAKVANVLAWFEEHRSAEDEER